ncbi:hypothetical protein Tco_1451045 [Tanacetum coccineum]
MVDEELDHFLDGNENVDVDEFMSDIFNNQEDPGTRIDPRTGDEFELRRRVKGKGIEETRSSHPPTPIRSLRTHIAP